MPRIRCHWRRLLVKLSRSVLQDPHAPDFQDAWRPERAVSVTIEFSQLPSAMTAQGQSRLFWARLMRPLHRGLCRDWMKVVDHSTEGWASCKVGVGAKKAIAIARRHKLHGLAFCHLASLRPHHIATGRADGGDRARGAETAAGVAAALA